MGILKKHISILCDIKKKENYFLAGKTLSISQLAVYANLKEVNEILKRKKIILNEIPFKYDEKNLIFDWQGTSKEKKYKCKKFEHFSYNFLLIDFFYFQIYSD